jgi:hypothetical protein
MDKKKIQLLITDLSSRLPYGIKGLHRGQIHSLFTIDCRSITDACIQVDGYDVWFSIDTFKPYLRTLSSMTEEEQYEYNTAIDNDIEPERIVDWYNLHHFDYRGLIPMGLALEATEGMYNDFRI